MYTVKYLRGTYMAIPVGFVLYFSIGSIVVSPCVCTYAACSNRGPLLPFAVNRHRALQSADQVWRPTRIGEKLAANRP